LSFISYFSFLLNFKSCARRVALHLFQVLFFSGLVGRLREGAAQARGSRANAMAIAQASAKNEETKERSACSGNR
jgi:hypothetical protein